MKGINFLLVVSLASCIHFCGCQIPGEITDIDGNIYKTLIIEEQEWMVENLKTTRYDNGDPIPNVMDDAQWSTLTTGAWCYYNNDEANDDIYGKLYNWYAVEDPRNLCPTGWHVPSDEEWKELEMFLGMSQAEADKEDHRGTNEGDKLKEAGTTHWDSPNTGATNESGFTALPGGWCYVWWGFGFDGIDNSGNWWSSTQTEDWGIYKYIMFYNEILVYREVTWWDEGLSVRCIKD